MECMEETCALFHACEAVSAAVLSAGLQTRRRHETSVADLHVVDVSRRRGNGRQSGADCYDKKFLIIGNVNAITYKEIFPLFRSNEMWLGASIHSGDRKFGVPEGYPLNAAGCGIDENGQRYIRVKGVRWFTNLDYPQRHEKLPLYKKYSPEEFPTYDNYDAINVNKTADIPYDYDGVMGVPITFMDKYNPEQFEIVGLDRYVEDNPKYGHRFTLNGRETYARILIRRLKRRAPHTNGAANGIIQ